VALKTLTEMHLFVAHLIAERRTKAFIAAQTGYSESWIRELGREPLLVCRVKEIRDELTAARVQKVTDLGGFFDDASVEAAKGLQELSKEADSDSVRRGAINDILAYSPNAPKQVKFLPDAGDQRLIQLGVAVVDGMKEALLESGQKDVVELLEGDGFEDLGDNGDEKLALRSGGVPVREV